MIDFKPLIAFDKSLRSDGFAVLCGIDEVGRGPLAGPVCAAAVILDENNMIDGLYDSKKVSEKKRSLLFDEICEKALAFGIGFASHTEIDAINILNATFLAMNRALQQIKLVPNLILVDGNQDPKFANNIETKTVVSGDTKSASIAAASIIAKVSRDRLMIEWDAKYPQYLFAKNKGYGTPEHYAAIEKTGLCEIHRLSFGLVKK